MAEEDEPGLLTLTMTREVFPHFKAMLEATSFSIGETEVHIEVIELKHGVIVLDSWSETKRPPDDQGA